MKGKIPVRQLKENISGVRIDKFNGAYVSSLFDDISKLHRNDHFICLLLATGSAELLVDFNRVHVDAERLVFLFPGQIQRAIRFNGIDGWILFLDHKLVEEQARQMIEDSFKGPVLSIPAPDRTWYTRYFELLFHTYNDDALGGLHRSAVIAFAVPLICKIASEFQATTDSASGWHSQRSVELAKKFRQLVRLHYRDLKRPGDYAALMSFSKSYLNDTIKSVTGFTATYFIQQEMLREGQRLLCYTDLSIKEVSAHLGYDDSKYFNRVFTKLAGSPPGRFRNNFRSLNT